jgi:hypothetical protein
MSKRKEPHGEPQPPAAFSLHLTRPQDWCAASVELAYSRR